MVRIRILRGQAAARVRSLRSRGFGGLVVAATIIAASLISQGNVGNRSSSSSVATFAAPALVAGTAVAAAGGPPEEGAHERDPSAEARIGEARPAEARPGKAPVATRVGAVRAPAATSPPARRGSHPSNLFQLPSSVQSALVFDLRDNRMHIYEAGAGSAAPIGDYFVAVGKNGIEKRREGDEKTPIGIYFVSSYIPGDGLPAIYGVGAFPITYPNAWDRRLGRTGSGIWIHGTDKDEASLLPQSSRGCLTLRNADFLTLSQFVRIRRTPVIVSDAVRWTTPAELEADRASLAAAVETWRGDWESRNTGAYFRHYSPSFGTDSMALAAWKAHKRRVNSSKSYIRIGVDDLGIYAYPGEPGLFLVTFEQRYVSNNFRGQKLKHQYWRREAGDWRIVHESGA